MQKKVFSLHIPLAYLQDVLHNFVSCLVKFRLLQVLLSWESFQDENDFWKKLIERYLTPLVDEKAHKDEVTRELKSLRNKVRVTSICSKPDKSIRVQIL